MDNTPNTSQNMGSARTIISKLTPKTLAILVAFGFMLIAIVLSIAVFRGSSVSIFGIRIGQEQKQEKQEKIHVKLKLNFNPNNINPRSPGLQVEGYIKSKDGREIPIPIRHGIDQGGIYVEADVDIKTPFFVEVKTPTKGIWKTDDYSVTQAYLTAYPILITD